MDEILDLRPGFVEVEGRILAGRGREETARDGVELVLGKVKGVDLAVLAHEPADDLENLRLGVSHSGSCGGRRGRGRLAGNVELDLLRADDGESAEAQQAEGEDGLQFHA